MDIYLVGGAVRDNLLGLTVAERDWVVVGGTPQALEDQGYRRVGKDFPVFLHPRTQEEYALARTERKTGPGYRGFDVYAGEDVTLEEDLQRRDLTINAMAETPEGELIDPWGGCADLEARLLRHVSDAFREDPLRVLRVARFAAKLSPLGFSVAPDTLKLMRDITATGELTTLTPERVWRETEKALRTEHPDVFIATLRACGALEVIFPEVDALYGVPQPEKWHPEVDTGVHIELVLRMSARLTESLPVRFAALVHDLGKGTTDPQWWPSHRDHERRGVDLITQLCARTAVPNHCRDLAIHVARYHTHVHRAAELRPDTYLRVLEQVDAFRRPERCEEFLLACEADARGRTGLEERPYHQAELFRAAHKAATETDRKAIQERGLKGPDFGAALREAQLANISAVLSELRGNLTD